MGLTGVYTESYVRFCPFHFLGFSITYFATGMMASTSNVL